MRIVFIGPPSRGRQASSGGRRFGTFYDKSRRKTTRTPKGGTRARRLTGEGARGAYPPTPIGVKFRKRRLEKMGKAFHHRQLHHDMTVGQKELPHAYPNHHRP